MLSLLFFAITVFSSESGEYCDFNCFVKALTFTLDFNGSFSFQGYNIPSLTFHDFVIQNITGSVNNETAPDMLISNITLATLSGNGPIISESSEKEIGYLELDMKEVHLDFATQFETYNYLGYNLIGSVDPSIAADLNTDAATLKMVCTDCSSKDKIAFATINAAFGKMLGFIQILLDTNMYKLEALMKEDIDAMLDNINSNYTEKFINSTELLHFPIDIATPLNITESSLIDLIACASNGLAGGNETEPGINDIFNKMTNYSGDFLVGSTQDTLPKLSNIILEAAQATGIVLGKENGTLLDVALKFVNVSGLNSWNTINLFDPLRNVNSEKNVNQSMCSEEDKCDFQVHNQMGLNALDILVKIALNLTVNGSVVSSNGETLRQDLGVAVALKYNEIDSRFQLVVDLNKFQNFSESMMVNGECWKGLMENGTGIPTIKVDTALDSFKVTAESVDIHEGIQTVINALSDIVVYTYKDTFPVLANGFANEVVRTSMNEGIENATIEECDYIVDPPFMSFDHEFVLIGVIVSVILGLIFCAIAIGFLFVRKREMKKKAEELQRTGGVLLSPEQVSVLSNETGVEKNEGDALIHEGEDEKSLWKKMSEKVVWFFKQYIRTDHEGVSMFLDDRISIIIRVIVPLVIFLTFAVFITDKTGIGCAVRVFVLFGNNNKINALVSSYGLMDTVTNMWHAGIYPLAILILLFSCIWPYTKLILLFFTWTTPPTIMSTKVRYRILYVLDALGKWSFLDSYVMTLMVVSFYFNVPLPIYHPENVTTPMKIQLWVDPEFCFTALVAGTIVTLLLSHVMLYIHEDILSSKTDNIGSEAVHKRPLFMYSRFIFVRILVVVLIIISMILVIVGMLLNSFSFDFMGMTGWALDLLNYPQHRIFSIMDLGIQLPGDTREPNSFVVRFIQVTYFVTIVAIPLLHMIMMLFLWVTPMTRKVQFYVLKMCQILYAWSCIDVFIISVIAAVVQLSQFAAFMVEPFCGKTIPAIGMSFDELIGKYLGDKKYVKGHETCFEVMAVLTSGCWTLFAGVIVYTVASLFITKISKKALDKRLPTQEEIDRYKAERREEDKLPLLEGTV